MNDIKVNRLLSDETEKSRIWTKSGNVYSIHIKNGEAIITDTDDFTKIYSIMSLDFFNENQ